MFRLKILKDVFDIFLRTSALQMILKAYNRILQKYSVSKKKLSTTKTFLLYMTIFGGFILQELVSEQKPVPF